MFILGKIMLLAAAFGAMGINALLENGTIDGKAAAGFYVIVVILLGAGFVITRKNKPDRHE